MTSGLTFSKKTWYSTILVAALCSLVGAVCILAGQDFRFLDTVAFALFGISLLFLAAQQAEPRQRGVYFGCFLLLMASYLFGGVVGMVASAAAWPVFIFCVRREGRPELTTPLRLLLCGEGGHLLLWLLGSYASPTFQLYANIFWLLDVCARVACAYVLLKKMPAES